MKKLFKKLSIIIFFLFLLFFLTSCYDYSDVSKTIHVNSIAFDYDEESSNYIVYFHLTNSSSLTTSELGGESNNNTFSIARGEGKDIYEAIDTININTNKKIKLTHVKAIIFQEKFINIENISIVNNFIKTSTYIFPDINLFVTFNEIDELFSLENVENSSPYFSLIGDEHTKEPYLFTSYNQLIKFLTYEKNIISFPILKATKDIWTNGKEKVVSLSIEGIYYLNQNDEFFIASDSKYQGIIFLESKDNFEIAFNNTLFKVISLSKDFKIINSKTINFIIKGKVSINTLNYNEYINLKDLFIDKVNTLIEEIIIKSQEEKIDIFDIETKLYRKSLLKNSFYIEAINFKVNLDFSFVY